MPPGFPDPAELQPHRDDSIARLLEKVEAKLTRSLQAEGALRRVGFTDFEAQRAEWRAVIDLLRRALADDALSEDARLETFRVQAEEMRSGAIWMLTAAQQLGDPLLREHWRTERPGIDESLDEILGKLEESRALALQMLPGEDIDRLREQGFLRPGE